VCKLMGGWNNWAHCCWSVSITISIVVFQIVHVEVEVGAVASQIVHVRVFFHVL